MTLNMINNTAKSPTLIFENSVLVLTYVDNAQHTTSDAENATLKDILLVVINHENQCSK